MSKNLDLDEKILIHITLTNALYFVYVLCVWMLCAYFVLVVVAWILIETSAYHQLYFFMYRCYFSEVTSVFCLSPL